MGYAKDRRLWAGIRFGRRLLPQSVSVARRIVQGGSLENAGGQGRPFSPTSTPDPLAA